MVFCLIVGTGSIARLLNDRNDFILFASGVSDSSIQKDEFSSELKVVRESLMLGEYIDLANANHKMLVYFGTIAVFTVSSFYVQHKKNMESLVRAKSNNWIILRVGNLWQCTNPNTFLNYLRAHPEAEVRENEIKYMIDADTLNMVVQSLPSTGKHEISVFTEMLTVKECLDR